MKDLQGTQTAENLMRAFAGESQARNRYTFASAVAQDEGFQQIKDLFVMTAENERAHAKIFYNLLSEGFKGQLPKIVDIRGSYPVFPHATTLDNLNAGIQGEREEWSVVYPDFAKIAADEGFPEVNRAFRLIADIEKHHDERYSKLYENVKNSLVFSKEGSVAWICQNCGHIHQGIKAPSVCPACQYLQSYFELHVANY